MEIDKKLEIFFSAESLTNLLIFLLKFCQKMDTKKRKKKRKTVVTSSYMEKDYAETSYGSKTRI